MKQYTDLARRRFVGWAASSALLAGGISPLQAKPTLSLRRETTELCGREFRLTIAKTAVNISGKSAVATTVNGMLGGPILRWREGDEVTIHVTNKLDVPSSIHWHGIVLPTEMDGVPEISFDGISPGETFTYRFRVSQSGTFWYHSHSGFQEQTGVYGAIVIEPREADPYRCERDYVVLLSDWSDEDPRRIYRKLKLSSDYYNFNQRTVGDWADDPLAECRLWYIIFITDGEERCPRTNPDAACDPGQAAEKFADPQAFGAPASVDPVQVYTVGFSESVAPTSPLECIANITNGNFYSATDAGQLVNVLYDVVNEMEERDRSFIPYAVAPPPPSASGTAAL